MTRKTIFDAIRDVRGRGFTQGEVEQVDRLLDSLDIPRPRENGHDAWIDLAAPLIAEFEGFRSKAYPDPGTGGEPWTIGLGSTTDEYGKPIRPGDEWTRDRAEARFRSHLQEFGAGVDKALAGKPATANQKAALVSLAYNIGLGAFGGSTVLKRHRAGDHEGAADAFAMWRIAGGKVMPGLVRRRAAEAKLYRGDA